METGTCPLTNHPSLTPDHEAHRALGRYEPYCIHQDDGERPCLIYYFLGLKPVVFYLQHMVQTQLSEKVFNVPIEHFFRWLEFITEVLPIVPMTDVEITIKIIF